MFNRATIVITLIIAALASAWFLNHLTSSGSKSGSMAYHDPDYYMEDFTTLTMKQDGTPKNKLSANYMAHYPDDDTTELLKPKLEIFRLDKPPLYMSADKGWIAADNEVILLTGDVELWEEDESGVRTLQVNTSKAHVLLNQEYAETDKYVKIILNKNITTGIGMRAYFKDSRLDVLNNVRTTIQPNQNKNKEPIRE